MNEQELQAQVEKLTSRLKNAATVFKTQKADIERLAAERDSALEKANSFEARIKEMTELESNYMSQTEELSNLEEQLADLKSETSEKIESLERERTERTQSLEEATKHVEDLQNKLNAHPQLAEDIFAGLSALSKTVLLAKGTLYRDAGQAPAGV